VLLVCKAFKGLQVILASLDLWDPLVP
jgi:hypothetical protein